MWYAEYVGAALGAGLFSFPDTKQKRNDPWLICSFELFSVKGHFCSLLISNIIGYLTFLNLDISLFVLIFFFSFFCFERIRFALTLSIDKIYGSLNALQFWDLNFWFLAFVQLDSWCWNLFWSVDFSPDLNEFLSFDFRFFLFLSSCFCMSTS